MRVRWKMPSDKHSADTTCVHTTVRQWNHCAIFTRNMWISRSYFLILVLFLPECSCEINFLKFHVSLLWELDFKVSLTSLPATDKVGVIVGAVIGALLLLILLLILIWLLIICCQKKRYQKEAANEIRYCITAGERFRAPIGAASHRDSPFCSLVLTGRMPLLQRADPPAGSQAGTPVSNRWQDTVLTRGYSTLL